VAEAKTVLIVDDDESFVESSRDLLEAFGYAVLAAHDGQGGLQKAVEAHPDLMILDVMMATPTEGFEVAQKARALPELNGMKILMVTGAARELHLPGRIQPGKMLPVDRVLEKPIDPEQLVREVERLLND
jgi:CheY-like chemotaxis protein